MPIEKSKTANAEVQVTISVDEGKQLTIIAKDIQTGEVRDFPKT